MMLIKSISGMKNFTNKLEKKTLGFVPTMGALHEGHESLIQKSKRENDFTVVSIFVNPTQFNNSKDFASYPKREEQDLAICKTQKVDAVFFPTKDEMYEGEEITLVENEITKKFEGEHRPGHFNGVMQVVLKLLNIVEPSKIYFGLKDYQQYLLIKKMAKQFFLNAKVVGVETKRDDKGLPLSSRNFNLSSKGLLEAQKTATAFLQTKSKEEFFKKCENLNVEIEYYGSDWERVFVAFYSEGVRLLDNKPREDYENFT